MRKLQVFQDIHAIDDAEDEDESFAETKEESPKCCEAEIEEIVSSDSTIGSSQDSTEFENNQYYLSD